MNRLAIVAVLAGATVAIGAPDAHAKGCLKGALVGGVAGHMAGHGVAGAAVGCLVGRHRANKKARAQRDPSHQTR